MAAFSFPDPPVENGTEVTNETTGVTYKYHLESDRWVVVTTNLATDIDSQISTLSGEVSRLDGEIEIALSERDELIEGAKGINDQQSNKIDALEKADDDLAQLIAFETSARQQGDAALQEAINGIEPEVDLSNYYTKAEIDNQFSLRGTGAIYLLSSFSGTPTIRQGEFNVNSRLAGQVTFISIAPFDDQGKRRRNVVAGDTIELYTTLTQNYYRYEVTRVIDGNYEVTYVGNVELRDDTFGSGWPFTIWLYPTHISPENYYTKAEIDQMVNAFSAREEVDQNEEQLQAVSTTLFRLVNKVDDMENLDIQNALSALTEAIQDIIELKSKVSSLEHTFSLHLE